MLPYEIDFENSPTATAPAQEVTISDPLDANLDPSTFQLTEIAFGDTVLTIPAGTQHYETTVSMTYNGETFNVDITAGINFATDTVYRDVPIGRSRQRPAAGRAHRFPPARRPATGRGQGRIDYTIQAKPGLATGTQITNVAEISFDEQSPIATDQVNDEDPSQGIDPTKQALITIDSGAFSTSSVTAPPTSSTSYFTVSWSGEDVPRHGRRRIGHRDLRRLRFRRRRPVHPLAIGDQRTTRRPSPPARTATPTASIAWPPTTSATWSRLPPRPRPSTTVGSSGISGSVYNDLNSNGRLDTGEPGLQGWTVFLDDNGNGKLDPGEEQTITDANGNFSFANLAAGTYTLRGLPTGWVQTQPGGTMSYQITLLGTGDTASDENFLNTALNFTSISHPTVVVGQAINNVIVAHFTDANTGSLNFNATITWADGTQTTGTVVPNAQGGYDVEGSHIYAAAIASPGAPFTVSVTDSDGSSDSLTLANVTVAKANTTTSVITSNNSIMSGQPVTFTATVTVANPGSTAVAYPTGTVTFYDGGTAIGTGTLAVVNGADQASYTTSSLARPATRSLLPTPAATGISTPVRPPRPSPK